MLKNCVLKLLILFAPECYKSQETCVRAVNTCFFVFDSVLDQFKTQEMCIKLLIIVLMH